MKKMMILIALVLATVRPAFAIEQVDADTARVQAIVAARLEPEYRDRVLKAWEDTAGHAETRQKLLAALEKFDGKMKPDWTGLLIGGGTTGLAAGIGAGVLAAKLGAVGSVAGPIGIVAGIAAGALVGYAIHKYHQTQALQGGVLSRTGRHLGFKGSGLEGDLRRAEDDLKKAAAPPPAPKTHWWNRVLPGRRASTPPAAPPAPVAPPAPAAPVLSSSGTGGAAHPDELNFDDVRKTMR